MSSNLFSGAKILLNCLLRENVECIFGYPGGEETGHGTAAAGSNQCRPPCRSAPARLLAGAAPELKKAVSRI